MSKILIIVDAQYDFIDGSLAVNSAKEKMNKLSEYITDNANDLSMIVFTCDWHPLNHCSFNEWPIHCVQHSKGAALFQPLIESSSKIKSIVLTKGDDSDKEEYSIMENPKSSEILLKILSEFKEDEIEICGIANEYCVNNTVSDLAKVEPLRHRICLLKDFIAAIKDDTVLYTTATKYGLKIK